MNMTAKEVYDKLGELIKKGYGDKPCYYVSNIFRDDPITTVFYTEESEFFRDAVYFE